MATADDRTCLRQLETLFNLGAIRHLTDGQLLERYATGNGEGAELAFAALVERHAAMVFRVCLALLGDPHDAQDAFQATFLILVKKARMLWVQDSIGPWLHQVAFRTASCARSSRARRRRLERNAAVAEAYAPPDGLGWERTLHEEVDRLPDRYRVPIVLCDLQGQTCEEAARRMGRPVGTIKCWRSRGRERLRRRLNRLGINSVAGLGASLREGGARASVSRSQLRAAAELAVRASADRLATGEVPASVAALVDGVIKGMLLSKLRTALVIVLSLAALTSGLMAFARVGTRQSPPGGEPRTALRIPPLDAPHAPAAAPDGEASEIWRLSLREAIGIGLGNNEAIRVVRRAAEGDPMRSLVVAPPAPDVDRHQFKSEVMALLRSIEQQYWTLAQAQVQYWVAETAVELGEQILRREKAKFEVGSGSIPNVAETQEQLERFRLDYVQRTSDLITTERQLRNLLGLPVTDGRRIVPTTAPLATRIEPNRDECLAAMLEHNPDIRRAREDLETADVTRDGAEELRRLTILEQRVRRQMDHALERHLQEVNANYESFETAGQLKDAASQRLEAQAASYDHGKTGADRYIDAVNRWASSVIQEAGFRLGYNNSIARLEELKGTLLERDLVAIAEPPGSATPIVSAPDGPVSRDESVRPAPAVSVPLRGTSPRPTGERANPDAARSYSFRLTFAAGSKPIEIRGSFTISPVQSKPAAKGD